MEFFLERPFGHHGGKCWFANAPVSGDSMTAQNSPLRLFENGQRLGPPHALHDWIANGLGFSHWGDRVYFASTDGSDPNSNGRAYVARIAETKRTPKQIRESRGRITSDVIEEYLSAVASAPPNSERCHRARAFSMLHDEALAIHELFAAKAKGRIVEIGPYIGASTVCLAAHSKHPVISIEAGGQYDHDKLPSTDIIRDLRNNIAAHDLTQRVQLIPSNTHFPEVIEWARRLAGWRKIGALIIDADGNIERDLEGFSSAIRKDCLLLIDDYSADTVKSPLVKPTIDRMVAEGRLEAFGVYGWGTWAGRVERS